MYSEALTRMIMSYQELNEEQITELHEPPSPLEFLRYVHRNRPFIIRGGAREWPAVQRWTANYLQTKLRDCSVKVAITPDGKADSAVTDPNTGESFFVKPYEQDVSIEKLIHCLQEQEASQKLDEVWYGQTQNDNLRGEYLPIFEDAASDIAWARIALGQAPDAINLWLGNSKSSTALHRDPYQNLYCQIRGKKQFTLVPPSEVPCVNEAMLPLASYNIRISEAKSGDLNLHRQLYIEPEADASKVPCALWDPDNPDKCHSKFSPLCRPIRVELDAGDILTPLAHMKLGLMTADANIRPQCSSCLRYGMYHKVTQTVGDDGICCAVNYWYDMDFSGSFFSWSEFLRQISQNCLRE